MKQLTLLCVAGALFTACSNELEPSTTPGAVKVTAIATTDSDNDTRLAFEEDNEANKLRVTWEESGESFPVFVGSNCETPTIFTQTGSSANHKTATFSGSVSAQAGDVIHAIYPRYTSYDPTLRLDLYEQNGSRYDANNAYMYAQATYADANTPLTFEFRHLTAALKATVRFPQGVSGTATNVKLVTSSSICSAGIYLSQEKPWEYSQTIQLDFKNDIAFVDEEGNPTKFPIVDGKITVYANLFSQVVNDFCLIAKVGDKYYIAELMDSNTLKAGTWYYPISEAKGMKELQGFTVDETTHTIDITIPDVLTFYNYNEIKNILTTIIDSQTGLLKITGTPSDRDLSLVGKVAVALLSENSSTLLKELDMSACIDVRSIAISAMEGVTSLEKVVLPSETTRINTSAFENCTSLAEINLENIKYVSSEAFMNCKSIRNFEMPSLTSVSIRAFDGTNFVNFNAPVLENLSGSTFSRATISGIVNLPKCERTRRTDFAIINDGLDQTFTLKLTREGTLNIGARTFSDAVAKKINLVLNPDKQSEVTNGNEWKGFTFKSITYEEPKDVI